MRIYGDGTLIHQAQTDDGVIEVVDNGDSRSLHFGTYPRQSSMRLSDPAHLALSYTQSMMGCLLLNPIPRRVLVIGLGGGSLVKFCCNISLSVRLMSSSTAVMSLRWPHIILMFR